VDNNAFRIKNTVEKFDEEKIVNETLLSRVFSPNFCYKTANGYALSRYLALGTLFPLFGGNDFDCCDCMGCGMEVCECC
jgi:hypothetical protein